MQIPTTQTRTTAPHSHNKSTVPAIMRQVIYALIPGIVLSAVCFGMGIIINCLLAILFALVCEASVLKLRQQAIKPFINDGTAVVTAILFALTVSPFTVWWITLCGIAFAIIIAKHLFGGIGHNPFNPAMSAYIFVLLCFPTKLAFWPDLSGLNNVELSTAESISMIFSGVPTMIELDAFSGATPLSNMQVELDLMKTVSEITSNSLYDPFAAKAYLWLGLAYLAGGVGLMMNKVIRWQIPVAVLASLFVSSLLFNFIDSDIYPSASYHVLTGGTMLCAFFIATDPASSPISPKGKILYGIGIGLLVYIIRTWGSYADGIAFAIIIMNTIVPLIDYCTRPKALGEK